MELPTQLKKSKISTFQVPNCAKMFILILPVKWIFVKHNYGMHSQHQIPFAHSDWVNTAKNIEIQRNEEWNQCCDLPEKGPILCTSQ